MIFGKNSQHSVWPAFLSAIALPLAGCSTPATVDLKTICLPLKQYSREQQQGFAAEDARLKVEGTYPLTVLRIEDYLAMRDADRACQKGS